MGKDSDFNKFDKGQMVMAQTLATILLKIHEKNAVYVAPFNRF